MTNLLENVTFTPGYIDDNGVMQNQTAYKEVTTDFVTLPESAVVGFTAPLASVATYNTWFAVCTYDANKTFQSRIKTTSVQNCTKAPINDTTGLYLHNQNGTAIGEMYNYPFVRLVFRTYTDDSIKFAFDANELVEEMA